MIKYKLMWILNLQKKERGDFFDVMFTSDLKRAIDSSNIAFPEIEKIFFSTNGMAYMDDIVAFAKEVEKWAFW